MKIFRALLEHLVIVLSSVMVAFHKQISESSFLCYFSSKSSLQIVKHLYMSQRFSFCHGDDDHGAKEELARLFNSILICFFWISLLN